ncbi:hypothetical protein TTHERM_00355000 (macronuclear) [Tetrahymena thermophila SB210]|uniref:PH domain-containing protein n=1 Tax=Tetrahymena thermophila (strain SB210) TaxID=312017 RepID=Q22Y71_TETTS|nr:hypothetical protein TTHERM_00355000 [Tetrahymena thermophila SB210]EAR90153.3 hypothetical protein TTHERM_00355000 [Tetrahymena thermophila SB210]|eukprot:XP_001010398.3 hypothetical protein TTHERM_00355000 [Tetrahymena thermophila SB210]
MHKNQSIQEDKEQQFAKPLDNQYARFDINSLKNDRGYNNQEEYEYNYQRDYNLSSVQVSQKSESKNQQIQSPNQQNGYRQNEVQIAEISFDENDALQIQKETPLFQGQANYPIQKDEANSYFKNYIAYLKHKNNASVSQESAEQRMQNPIQSKQNGNDQNMQSVNLSPISKISHQKSQSLNQSQDQQEQEEDNRSEISQIQKYILKKKEEHLNKQIEIKNMNYVDANNSQDLITQDNLDYAELIIKKKPKLIQNTSNENNPQIKKALITQFQEENQKESLKAQPSEDEEVIEGYKQNQSTEGEGELFVSNEEALQKAEEQKLSTYISRQVIRLSLQNQKKILFQGELQKYKPGLNYNFISRYITLNLESIKYYKDRVHSKCYEDKPLQIIPIASIQSVSKVQFQVPLLPKEKQRQKNNLQKLYPDNLSKNVVVYYFEIILDNNENKAENDSQIGNKIQYNHLMPQDKLDSYRNGGLNKKIKDLTTWSGRSHEWYESEQRLLFCTQDKSVLETWVAVLNWIISLKKEQNISSYSLLYSTERIEN